MWLSCLHPQGSMSYKYQWGSRFLTHALAYLPYLYIPVRQPALITGFKNLPWLFQKNSAIILSRAG